MRQSAFGSTEFQPLHTTALLKFQSTSADTASFQEFASTVIAFGCFLSYLEMCCVFSGVCSALLPSLFPRFVSVSFCSHCLLRHFFTAGSWVLDRSLVSSEHHQDFFVLFIQGKGHIFSLQFCHCARIGSCFLTNTANDQDSPSLRLPHSLAVVFLLFLHRCWYYAVLSVLVNCLSSCYLWFAKTVVKYFFIMLLFCFFNADFILLFLFL